MQQVAEAVPRHHFQQVPEAPQLEVMAAPTLSAKMVTIKPVVAVAALALVRMSSLTAQAMAALAS
jgi:hypothetical protein